ncbi:LysR family transcriptional regulator [Azospirillum formosense]|uniref:LysR family transcriptional regulator n=1 Tax=Azospirillum formosense TaxID=861533 RepID=A0ABX2L0L1_9PROT|nr:LysR family transcriptional regulator [Azospirillum formosense]MBY3754404.1 LysR family transcriptional regulator [Azospirillum formosense]NUB18720.1 LysR family transcriptional regulator [Azospirillum formosense]
MRPKSGESYSSINLWDLHVFQVIAERRSTTAAAERLGVTQSAVSQSVARLERWLGTELLDRSCRPIRVTHAGEILKLGAANILQNVRQTAEEVRAGAQGSVPLLRLGLIDSFATTVGHELVKALSHRVEQLQVWSGITPTLTSELLNRSVDVIVSNDPMPAHSELACHCLFREALIAAVPSSQAERFKALSLSEMCADLPLVRFSGRSSLGQAVEYYLGQRKLNPRRVMEFDASEAVLRMVAGGLGWAIATPLCFLQAHPQTLDVAVLPLPPPQAYRRVYLVYRRNELTLIMPDIIRICRDCVEKSILPTARRLAPWETVAWAEDDEASAR